MNTKDVAHAAIVNVLSKLVRSAPISTLKLSDDLSQSTRKALTDTITMQLGPSVCREVQDYHGIPDLPMTADFYVYDEQDSLEVHVETVGFNAAMALDTIACMEFAEKEADFDETLEAYLPENSIDLERDLLDDIGWVSQALGLLPKFKHAYPEINAPEQKHWKRFRDHEKSFFEETRS